MQLSPYGLGTYFELVRLGLGNEPSPINYNNVNIAGPLIFLTYYAMFLFIRAPGLRREKEKRIIQPHTSNCRCTKACTQRYITMIALLNQQIYTSGRTIARLQNIINGNVQHDIFAP